jgi:MFS family permease
MHLSAGPNLDGIGSSQNGHTRRRCGLRRPEAVPPDRAINAGGAARPPREDNRHDAGVPGVNRLGDGHGPAPSGLVDRVERAVGGRARAQVITTLAAVLALSAADTAAVGAAGPQLQQALHIGKTEIGLLLAVTSLLGAVATIPAGVLVDRTSRVSLLRHGVALWGVASAVSGFATSFRFLLVTRVALGVVIAAATPAVASLLGDLFPAAERSRVYGYVLAGELVGTGFGFVVCGNLAALSWRAAFLALVPPAAVLVWLLTRLPEPARGGSDRLPPEPHAFGEAGEPTGEAGPAAGTTRSPGPGLDAAPRPANVLRTNPDDLSLPAAVRYVLRVPSNVVLIVASALGYFFLAGVRGFGVEFVRQAYSLSQPAATSLVPLIGTGMLVGILFAGRIADRAQSGGHRSARITVAAASVLAAVALFVPALLVTSVTIAIPLLVLCGVGMGATNPPLDAARLDVMPPRLWGRAEAVRTLCQGTAQAVAPVLFGFVASHVGGANGLRDAFLLSLVPLALSALVLLTLGRRKYPGDVATARCSAAAYPAGPDAAVPARAAS